MHLELLLVATIICVILAVPGYLALRALGLDRMHALCCGPLVTVSLLSVMGELLACLGIAATPALMLVPVMAVPLAALLLRFRRLTPPTLPKMEPWAPVVFVALALALGCNLFVSRLPTADAVFQAYDIMHHLNVIQAMADSGHLSSFSVGPYLTAADQAICPFGETSFYPSAWHVLCALVVQVTGRSIPIVINASMVAFACVVFPLSMAAFLNVAFDGRRTLLVAGALVTMAFVAFPWLLLTFGPLYPNICGLSLMPAAMALFVHLFGERPSPDERVRTAIALVVGTAGLALAHPNTIFTCIVILAPWCVSRIWGAARAAGLTKPRAGLLAGGFVAFCLAFWIVCYHLPFFQDIVTHVWQPYSRLFQEAVNILTLSYSYGFFSEMAAQLLLGALVIAGLVRSLHTPGLRWAAFSYLLPCLILIVSSTQRDELKQLIAGFWYTDPMRIAAMAAIAAIPLAALGTEWAYETTRGLADAYNRRRGRVTCSPKVALVLGCAFLVVNFMPELNLPGLHYEVSPEVAASYKDVEPRDWPKGVHTTFGDFRAIVKEVYSYDTPLDKDECAFLKQVAGIVGDDLVINDPMDGSFLAYGYCGMRVYYRSFVGYGGASETAQSALIRSSLASVATNDEVRAAVNAIGARYVLVLSQENSEYSLINQREDFKPQDFVGISSITPETPGLTLIAQSGTLSLYEIDGSAA